MKKRGDVRISARDTLKTFGLEWLVDILFPEGD